jgi:hypothetical protein
MQAAPAPDCCGTATIADTSKAMGGVHHVSIVSWHYTVRQCRDGCFSHACISWDSQSPTHHPKSVVAIRHDLPDLGPREGERQALEGRCNCSKCRVASPGGPEHAQGNPINCWSTGKGSANKLQDKTATCKSCKLIGKRRRAKRKQEIATARDNKSRSKVMWDESIKNERLSLHVEVVTIQT